MSNQISINAQVKNYRPQTKEQLQNYVKAFMGISVPDKSLCVNHASPMDYLWHSFEEKSDVRNQKSEEINGTKSILLAHRFSDGLNPNRTADRNIEDNPHLKMGANMSNQTPTQCNCNTGSQRFTDNGQRPTVDETTPPVGHPSLAGGEFMSDDSRAAGGEFSHDMPQAAVATQNSTLKTKNYSNDCIVWAGRGGGQARPAQDTGIIHPHFNHTSNDCIVWAGRGGGKTFLAAIATVLDCIFKPGCKVRILGGSYEQSSRMYDYIADIIRNSFEQTIAGEILKDGCKFLNGSNIEVLTQSSKSVRGSHIHKLRCDEIELFDRDVFEAAKFITKSNNGIGGSMEILSTMHKPYGLMHEVITHAAKNHTPIFQWCVMEVIERCIDRSCSQCPLDSDCQGKAKSANGYLGIDDCITMMRRSSRASWESEMMCKRPSRDNAVFEDFDPAVHVGQIDYDPALPLYRTMDFGYINPFVCLWIQADSDGTVRVIDEYYRSRAPIAVHAETVKRMTPCDESKVAATFCDPAGAGRNDVTGTSSVRELYNMGIRTRYRRSGIAEGIELVRAAMRDGMGRSKLIISPRCPRLIEALQCYHYPDSASGIDAELPDKDGVFDHPIDALRYFFVNSHKKSSVVSRKY